MSAMINNLYDFACEALLVNILFCPQILKKLKGHIALGLSVRPSVRTKIKLCFFLIS